MLQAATTPRSRQGWQGRRRPGKFTFLLAAILAFLLVPPFFVDYRFTGIIATVFLSLMLLSVLYVFPRHAGFVLACILALVTITVRWLLVTQVSAVLLVVVGVCMVALLALTDVALLSHVLAQTRVTNDTISGAICGYLLLGIAFSFLYAVIGMMHPGSFLANEKLVAPGLGRSYYQHEINGLIYYSFSTLTTLGYGDIAPVSAPARAVAMIEAIAGQFYVAILIARLVSIRCSRWGKE